jgi:CDP-diacylglycerol---serine O-phosphatidyltransferase
MIRSFELADLFTIANVATGVLAIFHAMRSMETAGPRELWIAGALLPLAAVFDVLDGRIARWRQRSSLMGQELDSLADVVSFGVAPAAIAFAAGLRSPLDVAILVYFTACGVSRLARYNVTASELSQGSAKVAFFEGTPIPTSLVPVGLVLWAEAAGMLLPVRVLGLELHLVALVFLLSGSLMISRTLRIPKL